MKQTYNLTKEKVFEKFSANEKGLNTDEARERLKKF
ncbi:MAG: hypothetical protein UT03_C0005G0001, partial [Candidatus Moranbacteria bacterium GW2011_GWD2_38_7]